ncbi:MAG: AMP-binding protein, partial [Opitutaceae bacterium]|nr:AMP-binding protein [Opitutaceae bacterium]
RNPVVIPGQCLENLLREQNGNYDILLTDLPLDVGRPVMSPAALASSAPAAPVPPLPPWPEDQHVPGITFFTSGSTGRPKAVVKRLAPMLRAVLCHCERWGTALHGACVAGTTSHQHFYAVQIRILLPLMLGIPFNARLVATPAELLARPPLPFALVTSPAFLKRLDTEPLLCAAAAVACRHVVSCGGLLTPETAARCHRALGRWPFEIYGTTEAGGVAWRDTATERQKWFPMPGVRIHLCAAAAGRLAITSPFLADESVLVTDDLAEISSDGGTFTLLGRADRVVKIEETRVSLPEVERRILATGLAADAAVIPLQLRSRLVPGAVLVLSEQGRRRHAEEGAGKFLLTLRAALRPWLEPAALPRRLRIVPEIPANTQGKHSDTALLPLFTDHAS